MDNSQTQSVLEYLEKIPTAEYYDNLTDDLARKHIFNAQEEISDILIRYKDIKPTTRMIALQTLYNLEGEDEGISMLRRQGISDYTVKDIKAVLNKDVLSPQVFAIIDAMNDIPEKNNAHVGRLI